MRKIYSRFFYIAVITVLCSCGGSSSDNTNNSFPTVNNINWKPISTADWIIGDANQENFRISGLDTAFNKARDTNILNSLLVVRNDKLIAEAYFRGNTGNNLMDERSVTKTILALLVGVAIDEGYLIGLDQTIGSIFLDDFPSMSFDKQELTIRHLLTMSSGFQWNESQVNGYLDWANSTDPQGYLLNRDLADPSGTVFNYNSAGVHLLSVMLSRLTGMSTLEYAKEKLFSPLEINSFQWEILADGVYNGSAGLKLRGSDLAKIGLLLLNNGVWQQQIIIPSEWVQSIKSHQVNLTPSTGPFFVDGYGYLTWLGTGSNLKIQLAWGWGGQFIAVIPEMDMVVIVNCDWQVDGSTARSQYAVAFDIIINDIMAAAN